MSKISPDILKRKTLFLSLFTVGFISNHWTLEYFCYVNINVLYRTIIARNVGIRFYKYRFFTFYYYCCIHAGDEAARDRMLWRTTKTDRNRTKT